MPAKSKAVRYILLACAWISCILGVVGVFLPVLPTTPFILLSTFLFSKASPRLHAWMKRTKIYHHYVRPFKEAGGITLSMKFRIILISYGVLGLSAFFVQRWYVWTILGLVALFLIYLMFIRIPTVSREEAAASLERSMTDEPENPDSIVNLTESAKKAPPVSQQSEAD
ncbi:MAG: YbaN family protein [Eggerthellaceae bacterium]|nr:YbaN family protein [Eggerthellaceae bacterium]